MFVVDQLNLLYRTEKYMDQTKLWQKVIFYTNKPVIFVSSENNIPKSQKDLMKIIWPSNFRSYKTMEILRQLSINWLKIWDT